MSTSLEASPAVDRTAASVPCVESIGDELNLGNRQALKFRVVDQLQAGRRAFVLDFAGCGYIDSSGLGVLVSIAKKIRDEGGRLVLCGMNEDLQTLLELSKIATLFETTTTRERALTLLGSGTFAEFVAR